MMRDQMKVYQLYKGFKPCTFCSDESHFLTKCPHLNFVPDRNFIIRRYNYSEELIRKKICRRLKRSLNTRKNFMQVNIAALRREIASEKIEYQRSVTNGSEEENNIKNNLVLPQQLLSIDDKSKFQRARGSKMKVASNLLGTMRMNQEDNLLLESVSSEMSDEA